MYAGPVSEVTAMLGTSRLHKMEAEDFVSAGVRFTSGALGSIVATTAAYPGGAESIELGFEKASVRLESGAFTISYLDGREEKYGETSTTGGGADPMAFTHEWHASALRDFFTAVAEGRPSEVSGENAVAAIRLIDALTLSGREGRTVKMSELDA
jgi:UDP-N-acetyl-2-amino-2-deoxyglucuronate dehydrogenase